MAVTRINNNQITDASAGNVYVGIDASTKLQNYSVTAGKLANSLVYGSDLTVSGNLTVNGSSTAIDTTITTIEDPVIVLASTQTGSPAVDIGFIGERGTSENIAFVWDESAQEFVTVFTNTSETNTTINITGYANAHVGNMVVGGTTSLSGNVIGAANFTGNVTGGNLLTPGLISAAGNVTANYFIGNVQGNISAAGANTQVLFNDSGIANASAGFTFDKTSNTVSATTFNGNVSASGTVTAASTVGGVITGSSTSVTGSQTAASTVGGVITGSSTSVTGSQTAASTVGGVITGSSVSVTGNVDASNTNSNVYGTTVSASGTVTAASTVGGVITGSSTSVTGSQTAASTVGGVITGSSTSVTGSQTAASTVGGVITGSSTSVTGSQTAASTVGGVITGSSVSVTGNVTGGNVITDSIYSTGNTTLTINATTISLNPTGNVGMNSRWINNLADPVADQDAATKYYVDSVAQGLDPKASVVYATTANIAPYTYNNGASGVGATLTLSSTGNLTIDGNIVSSGQRVLIKNEVGAFVNDTTQSAAFNGIYVVTTAGAPGVAAVLTRSTDFDNGSPSGEIPSAFTFVEAGAVNADTGWVCTTNAPVTVGTTQIIFAQFSGAGSYTAGNALSLNGTQFNVNVDSSGNATIGINGSNQLYIPAGAVLTTPNIGAATGTSVSVSGAVTAASTVGGVITGSSTSVTGTQTAASTVGGVITGSSVSVTGGVDAASVVGGVITGTSTSVTGTQTAASTVGGVITGSSSSVTGTQTAASTVGGVITGSSSSVTGNITGGNLLTSGSGGAISGTGNITGGNILSGGLGSFTGNVTANYFIGNISGNIDAAGANTQVQFNDTGDILGATAGFTFDKTSNTVSATTFNGNVSASGTVTAASTVGGVITGSSSSVTGVVSGSNLSISGGNIDSSAAAITINGASADVNFAVNGDTTTAFFVDAGTGTSSFGSATQTTNAIVSFNSTNSILTPVGNTAQRPAAGVTGMLRFNSSDNNLELFDNSQWSAVGVPSFTVISDEQFSGDGVNVAFTLSSTQTTNSCIVSINGVVQIPTSAYSVSGTDPTCVLTFTEAPEPGDLIDVREITTTTTVTSISNSSGNAVVAVSPTSATTTVTGDLSVSGTILGGNINSTAITNGTSNVAVASSGGNVRFNIGGTSNVMVVSDGLLAITGDLSVSGNATLSGNILGDRIQNGTTSIDIQTASGNANITVGGTSNVAVFSPAVVTLAANLVPTANVTYDLGTTTNRWKDIWLSNSTIYMGNAQISANATSLIFTNPEGGQTVLAGATASITGASVSVTGTVTAASVVGGVITGSSVSVTGNVTAGNLSVSTGTITVGSIVNSNANGVGNIGSSTSYFNTVFAKATSAQYADLAEKYTADATYAPGTVVIFGGTHEVTVNATDADRKVAGVVSTNPSYIMNGGLEGLNIATVALTGRVPTFVVGPVRKGDMMVAAGLGRARAEADPKVGTVIGKALEDFDGAEGTIEVVVGRF